MNPLRISLLITEDIFFNNGLILENKIIYIGAFLDLGSKRTLLQEFPPKEGWTVHAGHCTLLFNPDVDYLSTVPFGEIVDLKIIGYAEDEKGQAVVVEPPDSLAELFRNQVSHITIATAPGVKPFYSNELLKKGYQSIQPIVLSGIIDAFRV